MWYLVFLAIYLKTSLLLVACNNFKWNQIWITVNERDLVFDTKYLQKQNLNCSTHVLIDPTTERNLIIEVEEKPYCYFFFIVWRYGYWDHGGFSKQSPWRHWPKNIFILTSWGTGKKLLLIEGCWSTSFTLLINCLWITYWEIWKIELILFLNK